MNWLCWRGNIWLVGVICYVDIAVVMEDVAAEAEPVEEAETAVGETYDVVLGVLLAQCK